MKNAPKRTDTATKNKSGLREIVITLIWAIILSTIIRGGIVEARHIPSGSMRPTMKIGDHFLINKIAYALKAPFTDIEIVSTGEPHRGDIVVFRFPDDKNQIFVKRILALPGETIEVRGKNVFIDGRLQRDPWGKFNLDNQAASGRIFGPFKVPDDSYFMMGDNRDASFDSRFWNQGRGAAVPREDILGKAFFRHWAWRGDSWGVSWDRVCRIVE